MENNKPITLVREDFMNDITMIINQYNLPFFIVEDVLRQILNGVSELSRKQLESDRQMYMQEIAKINSPLTENNQK